MSPTSATLSRHSSLRLVILAALFLAAIASLTTIASAQASSSSVNGIVSDQAGAVVSAAHVPLKNLDPNALRETVTNSAGAYVFTAIPPARYTLTFAAPTFQTQSIAAFEVAVAQAVTINATLRTGSVS